MEFDEGTEADPDEAVPMPVREIAAVLELLRACASVIDGDPSVGQQLSDAMTVTDGDLGMLPEVGIPHDVESVRLFMHMLHARVKQHAGVSVDQLPPPPVTVPTAADGHRILDLPQLREGMHYEE